MSPQPCSQHCRAKTGYQPLPIELSLPITIEQMPEKVLTEDDRTGGRWTYQTISPKLPFGLSSCRTQCAYKLKRYSLRKGFLEFVGTYQRSTDVSKLFGSWRFISCSK